MPWEYQRLFAQAHPQPPWTCYFCGRVIDHRGKDNQALTVHHVDHDHSNMDLENLVSAHRGCHNSYHSAMHTASAATREKMRQAMLGRVFSDETRARMSASHIDKKMSEAQLAELHARPKEPCEVCGVPRTVGSPMANHMRIHTP